MDELIRAHIRWLKASGAAENTVDDRRKLLTRMDKELPYGVEMATEDELVDFLAQFRAVQTKATYLTHIRGFYRWACDPARGEHLDFDPSTGLRRPRVPEGTPRPATDDELALALTVPAPWIVGVVLAAFGGLRCFEIASLRRQDVTAELITIDHGKGGKAATVDTHPMVWRYVEPLPKGPVIRKRNGRPADATWLSQRLSYQMHKAGAEITAHQLRHWYATTLLEYCGNLRVVQEGLRHSNLATVQVYTKVRSKVRRDAIRNIPVPGQGPTAEQE